MKTEVAILTKNETQRNVFAWVAIATLIIALLIGASVAAPKAFAAGTPGGAGNYPGRPAWTLKVPPAGGNTGSVGASDSLLAENPELVYSKAFSTNENAISDRLATKFGLDYAAVYGRGTASASLADNPELVYAQAFSANETAVSDSLATKFGVDYAAVYGRGTAAASLADNPELVYVQAYNLEQNASSGLLARNPGQDYAQVYGRGSDADTVLAENPELVYAQAAGLSQGSTLAACVVPETQATLAANPELVYATVYAAQLYAGQALVC